MWPEAVDEFSGYPLNLPAIRMFDVEHRNAASLHVEKYVGDNARLPRDMRIHHRQAGHPREPHHIIIPRRRSNLGGRLLLFDHVVEKNDAEGQEERVEGYEQA